MGDSPTERGHCGMELDLLWTPANKNEDVDDTPPSQDAANDEDAAESSEGFPAYEEDCEEDCAQAWSNEATSIQDKHYRAGFLALFLLISVPACISTVWLQVVSQEGAGIHVPLCSLGVGEKRRDGYYASMDFDKCELSMRRIVRACHKPLSYSDLWSALVTVDEVEQG